MLHLACRVPVLRGMTSERGAGIGRRVSASMNRGSTEDARLAPMNRGTTRVLIPIRRQMLDTGAGQMSDAPCVTIRLEACYMACLLLELLMFLIRALESSCWRVLFARAANARPPGFLHLFEQYIGCSTYDIVSITGESLRYVIDSLRRQVYIVC